MARKQRDIRFPSIALVILLLLAGSAQGQETLEYKRQKEQISSETAHTTDDNVRRLAGLVVRLAAIDLSDVPKWQRDRERFLLTLVRKFSDDRSYAFRKTALITLGKILRTANGIDELFAFVNAGSTKRSMRKDWAILALSHLESPVALDRLCRRGLSHRSKRIRELTGRALSQLRSRIMRERAAHYRDAIKALTLDDDAAIVAAGARAAGNLNLEIMDALVDARRHKDSLVRKAVAWALGRLIGRPHARDGLAELLQDSHPRVREEAALSLGLSRDVEVCGDLIPRLRREGRRNRHAIIQSLRNLTGLDFGETIGSWESWWTVAEKKLEEGKSLGIPTEKVELIPGGQGRYDARYYGVPIYSDRVLFILDISQSMRFGGIQDDPDRLEMAKAELKRTIDFLKPDMRFNILVFSTGNAVMSTGKLIPANARNRRRAKKWVDRLVAAGGTNTFGALKEAFKKQGEVDTIYLLSDGEPSRGGITDPEALLAWVRSQNLRRKLIINTIALVKWHPMLVGPNPTGQADAAARFMEELATITRGKFVRLD